MFSVLVSPQSARTCPAMSGIDVGAVVEKIAAGRPLADLQPVTAMTPDAVAALVKSVIIDQSGRGPTTIRIFGASNGGESLVSRLMSSDVVRPEDRILVLCRHAAAAEGTNRRQLFRYKATGAQVRLFPGDLPNIVTLGPTTAILELASGPAEAPSIYLVRNAELVGALALLHGSLWAQSIDLESLSGEVASLVLDEPQSQVLSLLCSGVKDETAARRLKVSVRTYRRHVADIMKKLNVASRFEAGLRISELGLVTMLKPSSPPPLS